jgi:hypothetical protein
MVKNYETSTYLGPVRVRGSQQRNQQKKPSVLEPLNPNEELYADLLAMQLDTETVSSKTHMVDAFIRENTVSPKKNNPKLSGLKREFNQIKGQLKNPANIGTEELERLTRYLMYKAEHTAASLEMDILIILPHRRRIIGRSSFLILLFYSWFAPE